MDQDVKEKLLSLSFVNIQLEKPKPEQCWVDGSVCPYGRPEGQFALRPKPFCRPLNSHGGCAKLSDHGDDILETLGEKVPESLADWLSANKPKKISQILSEIVENEIIDKDEKIVLVSTIGIIQGNAEMDLEIYQAEDLKDE